MTKDILDLLDAQVSTRAHATALLSKRGGRYEPRTWSQLRAEVEQVARSLIAIGIGAGDRVAIVSNTRHEWVVLDLGIVGAGAITVPIYPSNLADECRYVADDAGVRLVFCEDAGQVAKFVEVREQLPGLVAVVQMSGELEPDHALPEGWVITMAGLLALAEERGDPGLDEQLVARRSALEPESIYTIIYTAGTTGRPKGVVLTHANMLYEGRAIVELGMAREGDVQLLFLPLAHSFARCLEITWLACGHVLAFAESMTTIKQNLAEVRPTLMAGVPRVFEKFYAAVVDQGLAAGGLKAKLFARTLELSFERGELELKGKRLPVLDALVFGLLRKLVLAKVHAGVMKLLGGRMRFMLSGGAPLALRIAWFFRDADIEILEGYGLTESSAGTVINRPGANQIGTVGLAMPGTEVRIAEDGEVLLRGPGIMRGYWRQPEATAETMVGEWFATGDIGELDPRTGALRITDRKKDLIITAGGKNISPQKIENAIKADPLISHCVVHGDRRAYLSALVTLDEAALREFIAHERLAARDTELAARDTELAARDVELAELVERPEVRARVEAVIAEANRELPSYETIKKFVILPADFSIEAGELTPKLSVRRKVVNQKYAALFEGMYE